MGKPSPSPPPAVDPAATAAAQASANVEAARETARLNQFNQVNPFGSLTFTGEIGEPGRTATTALNPQGQRTFDIQQALAEQLSGLATQRAGQISTDPFSLSGLPGAPQADDAARQRIEAGLFARLNPQLERQEDQLRTRLANQGITQGSEAFGNALGDFSRGRNDLRLATIAQGGAEQSRQFGLETAARQNALQEALTQRALPQNELAALLQGSPAVGIPQFGQPGQIGVGAPDILGAQALQQQQQLAQFNAANQRQQAGLGGLFGLGAAGISAAPFFGGGASAAGLSAAPLAALPFASDVRVKKDIHKLGWLENGLGVYAFKYIFDPTMRINIGVMAQEVEQVIPQAVHEWYGIKYVDYGMI